MVRKYDRIVGTLLIWIAIPIAILTLLNYFLAPRIGWQNAWYWPVSIITTNDPEAAGRALQAIDEISYNIQTSLDQFARDEVWHYAPLLLLIMLTVLAAGALCTYFIWRSVRLPDANTFKDEAGTAKLKNSLFSRRRSSTPEYAPDDEDEIRESLRSVNRTRSR